MARLKRIISKEGFLKDMRKRTDSEVMMDLYEGSAVQIWEDGELVFLNVFSNGVTLCMLPKDFVNFKEELAECPNLPGDL